MDLIEQMILNDLGFNRDPQSMSQWEMSIRAGINSAIDAIKENDPESIELAITFFKAAAKYSYTDKELSLANSLENLVSP